MSRKEKLLKKFLERPESLRYGQIEGLLLHNGFQIVYIKGSHVVFVHEERKIKFSVPVHNNDCKNYYKKKISKIINFELL